jgi:hypothetical protein
MARVIDDYRDPAGEVLTNALVDAAANVFDLHHADGVTAPTALGEVAAEVAVAVRRSRI